jgi:hypothetical protein
VQPPSTTSVAPLQEPASPAPPEFEELRVLIETVRTPYARIATERWGWSCAADQLACFEARISAQKFGRS